MSQPRRDEAWDAATALQDRIEHSLTNHAPGDPEIVERFELIRFAAKDLGAVIAHMCPSGRETSLAVTHLEETVMWAVKAIACNQAAEVPGPPRRRGVRLPAALA